MSRHRLAVLAVLVTGGLLATMAPTHALTQVERAVERRREITHIVQDLRGLLHYHQARVRAGVPFLEVMIAREVEYVDDARWNAMVRRSRRDLSRETRGLAKVKRRLHRRILQLGRQRDALGAWLEHTVVFRVCPVPGYTTIYDDFGEMVRLPDVPIHRHMGSDILAPTMTPILAPFDGYATASWGKLGGREVRVSGERGYVYNAHLAAVGRLGPVRAGQVIGYIGATGDATAPHVHLEWHPGGGPAIDPYPLLAVACLPVSP